MPHITAHPLRGICRWGRPELGDHSGDFRRLRVRLGQAGDRLVSVESTGIGHHPNPGAHQWLGLFAFLGLRGGEGYPVRSDASDGDDYPLMMAEEFLESG